VWSTFGGPGMCDKVWQGGQNWSKIAWRTLWTVPNFSFQINNLPGLRPAMEGTEAQLPQMRYAAITHKQCILKLSVFLHGNQLSQEVGYMATLGIFPYHRLARDGLHQLLLKGSREQTPTGLFQPICWMKASTEKSWCDDRRTPCINTGCVSVPRFYNGDGIGRRRLRPPSCKRWILVSDDVSCGRFWADDVFHLCVTFAFSAYVVNMHVRRRICG